MRITLKLVIEITIIIIIFKCYFSGEHIALYRGFALTLDISTNGWEFSSKIAFTINHFLTNSENLQFQGSQCIFLVVCCGAKLSEGSHKKVN